MLSKRVKSFSNVIFAGLQSCNQSHQVGGVIPVVTAFGFRRLDQFTKRQGPWVDPSDRGQLSYPSPPLSRNAFATAASAWAISESICPVVSKSVILASPDRIARMATCVSIANAFWPNFW